MTRAALALVPWVMASPDFRSSEALLREALPTISAAGFDGVPIDVPADMKTTAYDALLAEHGLLAAPGYFSVPLEGDRAAILELASRHATQHRDLGVRRTYLAGDLISERVTTPAIGLRPTSGIFADGVELMAEVAALLREAGVEPLLHQHVASWIETEGEVQAVLDAIPASILSLGPDTGHLAWAGIDVAPFIARHASRVRGLHLKDVSMRYAAHAAEHGVAYFHAATSGRLWVEPGRGDIDFDAVLQVVKDCDIEWYVVEVDHPGLDGVEASTVHSGAWIAENLGRTA